MYVLIHLAIIKQYVRPEKVPVETHHGPGRSVLSRGTRLTLMGTDIRESQNENGTIEMKSSQKDTRGGLTLAPAAPFSPLAPSRPGWPYRNTPVSPQAAMDQHELQVACARLKHSLCVLWFQEVQEFLGIHELPGIEKKEVFTRGTLNCISIFV